MEGKGKIIFPVIVTGIIVFIVSFLVTFLNIGLRADFVFLWLRAFFTAWPLAALVAFFAIPLARRLTQRLVVMLDGQS
jgi:uncharacterized protein DUF2798